MWWALETMRWLSLTWSREGAALTTTPDGSTVRSRSDRRKVNKKEDEAQESAWINNGTSPDWRPLLLRETIFGWHVRRVRVCFVSEGQRE